MNTNGPSGLGGWLILPALGLFVTPIRGLTFLATSMFPMFENGGWEYLTTPGSDGYHPLWAPLMVFEIAGNLFFVAFALILLVMFFSKFYRFPGFMIAFYLLNVVFVVADAGLVRLIPFLEDIEDPESHVEIVRAVVAAGIWVPYFMISKRVRNTFVKTELDRDAQEAFQ